MGRSTEYTQELGDAICLSIASGESAREACRKSQVDESTFRAWRRANITLDTQYARAVQDRADVFFERGNDIAMAISSPEDAQVARVQLDWLKWSASRLAPKQYGDKMQQEVSGPNGGPMQAEVTIKFVKSADGQG